MTVAEAATILQLSEGGVRYLIREKRLPAQRRKAKVWVYFIRPSDLGKIKRAKRGRPAKEI